jgi:flagellar biosynthesis protein FliR
LRNIIPTKMSLGIILNYFGAHHILRHCVDEQKQPIHIMQRFFNPFRI